MPQLSISSTFTDDLPNTFRQNGYLFLRSFFSPPSIQQVREKVINILEKEGWGQWEGDEFIAVNPVRRINSPEFHKCISQLMREEVLHELSQSASLCDLLSQLLGEAVYPHPRKMVRITYPYAMNPKDRVPPHQDIVYVKGERDTFTVWIPLGDYPLCQGGLELSPQTHKQGLFAMQANDEGRFGCTAIEEPLKNFSWHGAHYHPGDLLIMHSLTLHRSGINESRQFRLSLDCRFSSAKRTINEDQLLPPYHPHVPGWDQLSDEWKKKDRFAPPSTLQIHAKDKDLDKVLMTTSRFV